MLAGAVVVAGLVVVEVVVPAGVAEDSRHSRLGFVLIADAALAAAASEVELPFELDLGRSVGCQLVIRNLLWQVLEAGRC